jgi:hypothetical protein
MLEWLLMFAIIWLCLSVIIIATGWYMAESLQSFFPNWWKRVIADDEPEQGVSVLSSPVESVADKQPNLQETSR